MFASMSFYGAIEQLLSGWIFGSIPASDADFDQARSSLSRRSATASSRAEMVYCRLAWERFEQVDNDIVKRLVWSGLLAATGALASIVAARTPRLVYRRIYNEDPPE